MAKVARDDETITYTVFVRRLNRKVQGLDLRPHDDERLDDLLDAISIEEERDGRGLISVLVVELAFPGLPSDGFFELAAPRHLPGTKKRVIFETERDRVWAAHPSA